MSIRHIFIFVLTAAFALAYPGVASAQYADTLKVNYGLPKVKTEEWSNVKKIGLSWLEGEAYNLAFLHFDKYILKADYAQVTFESIERNLKFGTGWDNDAVGINFVGHPAQGAVYHIINRLNGMSFWGSLPIAFINSSTWELFCETEPPSLNDFLTTTWNGVVLGEALWRIGNYAVYKSARKRVDFSLKAGLNARTVTELSRSGTPGAGFGASATLDIVYGDRMHVKNNAPMNFFDLHLTAAAGTGQSPVSEFTLLSRLWGLELETKKGEAIFGIYDNASVFLSESWTQNRSPYRCAEGASVGPGIIYRSNGFTTGAFFGATLIGAATTDYYDVYDRDYNFGSGYSVKSLNSYKPSDTFTLEFNLRHYQLFTYWGDRPTDIEDRHYVNSMGDNGTTLTEVMNLKAIFKPAKHLGIEMSAFCFHRNSYYAAHPHASSSHLTAEIGLRYCLNAR